MVRSSIVAVVSVAAGLAVLGASVRSLETDASDIARSQPPLVGFVVERGALARVDPHTLRPLPGRRLEVGLGGCVPRSAGQACFAIPPWTRSPDGSRLAVARNGRRAVRSLRLVDMRRLRVASDLRLAGGPVGLLAWLAPRRMLAVQEVCCGGRQRLVAVDPASGRVLASRPLRGAVVRVARTARALLLLVAPAEALGPARLLVAGRRGTVKAVRLERVRAGSRLVNRAGHRIRQRLPGLAVDEAGRRAFVVEPGLVAEVDLDRLSVSHHDLADQPPAQAVHSKGADGRTRIAHWLGGGVLAVSGADEGRGRVRPAGLSLVDTRSWTARTIDRDATDVVAAGDVLLAVGAGRPSTGRSAIGLAAYALDGVERFRLLAGREAWVQEVYGGRAYVGVTRADGRQEALRVVELASGRVVGRHHGPLPWLVLDTPASWWESP